jgi:hypothetical protein
MKVFVSWSGKVSHEVALTFKEWLPLVIQSIDPYVSSEDIQKGARWSSEVEKALSESRFGIICLTEDNLLAPWIHFEAGALSKAIENSQINVCPFLFNIRQSSVEGPLQQFQCVRHERNEIFKLVSAINASAKGEHERVKLQILEQSFDAFWPKLEAKLKDVAAEGASGVPVPKRKSQDVLEEILEIVRSQNRLVASRQDWQNMVEWLEKKLDAAELSRAQQPLVYQMLNTSAPRVVPVAGMNAYANIFYDRSSLLSTDNPVIPPELETSKPRAPDSDANEKQAGE